MQRAHFLSLMALVVAVPVAASAASSFFSSTTAAAIPCFAAGKASYEMSRTASADYTVRIDNAAVSPSLRMQIVDDPAAADFVLVDEDDALQACQSAASVKTIRIDAAAAEPDVTVAMTRNAADYKVFVKSAVFTQDDAAALFAVIWRTARKNGNGLAFATGISR